MGISNERVRLQNLQLPSFVAHLIVPDSRLACNLGTVLPVLAPHALAFPLPPFFNPWGRSELARPSSWQNARPRVVTNTVCSQSVSTTASTDSLICFSLAFSGVARGAPSISSELAPSVRLLSHISKMSYPVAFPRVEPPQVILLASLLNHESHKASRSALRGGTLAFWHCSSSVEAGGLLIEANMNWSDGSLGYRIRSFRHVHTPIRCSEDLHPAPSCLFRRAELNFLNSLTNFGRPSGCDALAAALLCPIWAVYTLKVICRAAFNLMLFVCHCSPRAEYGSIVNTSQEGCVPLF